MSFFACTATRDMHNYSTYHRYIERPFTYPWGILKGTSCTWLYIRRPLVINCALENTTTDLNSHIPCLYREALLWYLRPSKKIPFGHLVGAIHQEQNLGRLLCTCHQGSRVFRWGMIDPPCCFLLLRPVVYYELQKLENPSEELTYSSPLVT